MVEKRVHGNIDPACKVRDFSLPIERNDRGSRIRKIVGQQPRGRPEGIVNKRVSDWIQSSTTSPGSAYST